MVLLRLVAPQVAEVGVAHGWFPQEPVVPLVLRRRDSAEGREGRRRGRRGRKRKTRKMRKTRRRKKRKKRKASTKTVKIGDEIRDEDEDKDDERQTPYTEDEGVKTSDGTKKGWTH